MGVCSGKALRAQSLAATGPLLGEFQCYRESRQVLLLHLMLPSNSVKIVMHNAPGKMAAAN
jgi:hypothetical protein